MREWTEVIDRDYSHPCVIVWVPFNESWGVPELPSVDAQRHAVETLYHLTKTLDATRPVIGNDGWESSATDIIGIHDYDADIDHLHRRYGAEVVPEKLFEKSRPAGRLLTLDGHPHKGQPIMLTEFGGIAVKRSNVEPGHEKTWGYTTTQSAEEFGDLYERLIKTIVHAELFSGFCYTQFADTFQEGNGLLNADRSPKLPLARIHAATTVPRSWSPGMV
ncbi:glycoside hydrolase family 2 TIM barrel-domain containing protein [Variovorax sp. J22R133]|uniref:glycoside hydrolase family 2 TIM barrel-domain containing protein n=1 Tax=Variovorax brevis TaxID=3053503 RepID=UPI002575F808|nr:glycoside hydrolase family 2 TIM barrel-domain containing protein [Variovorax sp. J22R133]MDM0117255.1 glycoside hydrolase family 2 TIM barrel-domain containing protein [Variovorax sp. J22R133]